MTVHRLHEPVVCIFLLILRICAALKLQTRMGRNVTLVIGFVQTSSSCLIQMRVFKISLWDWVILLRQLRKQDKQL